MDAVLYTRDDDGVGTITLARPDNRNSMTEELLTAFAARIAQARADRSLRALIVTGQGKSFSAGADFRSQIQRELEGRVPHERSFAMYEPFLGVLDLEVPVIGALNGHAIGGGFGLALVCDLRIASNEGKYGANFVRLGLHPGMAVTHLLPAIVGPVRAADWLLTGRLFDAAEGVASGLFNHAVDAADVLPRALELARQIAACAPIAVRLTKRSLVADRAAAARAAAYAEAHAQATTVATEDAREGMQALLDKRAPQFRGR